MTRSSLFTLVPAAVVAAIVAAVLTGCGKSEPVAAPAARSAAQPTAAATEASAIDVARQARGDLSCPPRNTTPARADGAPVDDVLGVRPGLTYDEAVNLVLCTDELLVAAPAVGRGFDLKAAQAQSVRQGFTARPAEPRVAKTSKQVMKEMQDEMTARGSNRVREDLKPGQARWFVATMGLQGRERVLSVAREERFAAEQSPTVEATRAALLKKYGAPNRDQPGSDGQLPLLRWVYDPQGRRLAGASQLAYACHGTNDPNGSVSLAPDCGIVVQALLIPQKTNPALVDRLQVGVVDQAGGYRLIAETEQGLGQADQQRRAQEVDRAAKNAKAPSL